MCDGVSYNNGIAGEMVWDPNKAIDIEGWLICGSGRLERFYCMYMCIYICLPRAARAVRSDQHYHKPPFSMVTFVYILQPRKLSRLARFLSSRQNHHQVAAFDRAWSPGSSSIGRRAAEKPGSQKGKPDGLAVQRPDSMASIHG